MPLYRDEAVILRTQPLAEADRIVTALTREHGKVRAVAKGVRRTSSRFGGRLEPFMHVDLQCYEGRNLDTVTQVETLSTPARDIAGDYDLYTAAGVLVEAADRLVVAEREHAGPQYRLLLGALHALSSRRHRADLVQNSYLLRAMAIAGYAPSILDCAQCGLPGPHTAFAVASGGAVCAACRPAGSAAPAPETFDLLAALLAGQWEVADASDHKSRREAGGLVAAFTQYHLERSLRSLRLVGLHENRSA